MSGAGRGMVFDRITRVPDNFKWREDTGDGDEEQTKGLYARKG